MKKIGSLFFILIALAQISYAQNTVAKLKYEQAEEAFNNGDYQTTLSRLDEVEGLLGSSNAKILYLRIQAQYKFVESSPLNDYNLLESLRANTVYYLKNYEKNSPEEKYKEIYLISDALSAYPKSRAEFDAKVKLKKEEEEKQKKLAEEKLRLEKEANEKAAKELEIKRQYDNKYSGTTLSFHSGTIAHYGISIDYWERTYFLGFSASFRSNFKFPKSVLYNTYDYKKLNDSSYTKTGLNLGMNFPIFKLLRGYVTGGAGVFQVLNEYDMYEKNGTYLKKVFYPRSGYVQSDESFMFECGVGLILPVYKRLTVKGGLSWANFKHREITFGVGLDLKKNK